jgi:hypothetical protein
VLTYVGALAEGPVANFGYGGSCEGMMSLEGVVRQDIRRAYLRMPDGIEVPLSIATPPLGLETDHKNLVAGVFRGSGGTFVGIDADGQAVEGPRVTC